MRNIHLIATDKPSRLYYNNKTLILDSIEDKCYVEETKNQHIYITNDETIKIGDWHLYENEIHKTDKKTLEYINSSGDDGFLKIILTTDLQLIADGVQAINDEFLEWFVKNPNCEEVEVDKMCYGALTGFADAGYKIVIPKEEPKQEEIGFIAKELTIEKERNNKQETIEEAAERMYQNKAAQRIFIKGAKWQQKRMYSEEECYKTLHNLMTDIKLQGLVINDDIDLKRWFEQFKNK
jgi:hypothetical protein